MRLIGFLLYGIILALLLSWNFNLIINYYNNSIIMYQSLKKLKSYIIIHLKSIFIITTHL